MENYILISYLNDFVFCPRSIYFHQLHGNRSTRLYHDLPQTQGRAAHESIDEKRYSTRKDILQGIEIYSEKYGLCGKIDIFEVKTGLLTERKKHITVIYDGYVFQLYAQYFGLTEMGYSVKSLRFYSSDDNKTFPVPLPAENPEMLALFESTIQVMKTCDLQAYMPVNSKKCQNCIYETVCDRSLC